MDPQILLVDEPSIGLEPRFINRVFDILADLQHTEGKTVVLANPDVSRLFLGGQM